MSTRDQRVGTSHPDIVKEDVSLEYITMSHRLNCRCVQIVAQVSPTKL